MIDYERAFEKTQRKTQMRYGISIVHFINNDSDLIRYINYMIGRMDKKIFDMFVWSKCDSLHFTILRCSSSENKVEYKNAIGEYVANISKNMSNIIVELDSIRLDDDGVIRLYSNTPLYTAFDCERLFQCSEGLRYKKIEYPWITLAYLKPKYLQMFAQGETDDYITSRFPQIYYNIDSLSVVKFSDTEFRNYKIVSSFHLLDSRA